MSRMSLNRKLWLSLALVWLGLLGVGLWSAVETRSTMLAERKAGMVNLVEAAQGVVNGYYALSQGGRMSEPDAQREALEHLAVVAAQVLLERAVERRGDRGIEQVALLVDDRREPRAD